MDDLALSITLIKKEFNLSLDTGSTETFILHLSNVINEMIRTDFPRLINILYRLDVNEGKLKKRLKEDHSADAGVLIAKLVIERQMQKIESRKQSGKDEGIPGDEGW